jgi:hypothetical protein
MVTDYVMPGFGRGVWFLFAEGGGDQGAGGPQAAAGPTSPAPLVPAALVNSSLHALG